jgi:prepilin-type N-terminal cleavage/methylation domain-containing protein
MFRHDKTKHEEGFTLIEILVVVLIIGTLASLAIPVFLNQRQKASDATLISDTRNAATAIENYYASGKKMSDLVSTAGTDTLNMSGANTPSTVTSPWNSKFPDYKINISSGSIVNLRVVTAPASTWRLHQDGEFCLTATSPNSKTYGYPGGAPLRYGEILYYDVALGGIVDFRTIVNAYKNNQPTSCSGFAGTYIGAGGV